MKTKIFIFVNGSFGRCLVGQALAEDGRPLGNHASSNEDFVKHDMGLTSDWKHEIYRKHCPNGYELVWVPDATPGKCPELDAAYERHRALDAEAVNPEGSTASVEVTLHDEPEAPNR